MPVEASSTQLRQQLAAYLDRVVKDQEVVIVRRRGTEDVALIPASELSGLVETAHLFGSPNNAKRLLSALQRAQRGRAKPSTVAVLRRELGLESAG
jgi:antitoxin YefM